MKIHAITGGTDKGTPPSFQNSWAYRSLFHGDVSGPSNRYGERPYRPLGLTLNSQFMPSLFIPITQMIVDEAIADRLRQFNAADLSGCMLDGVYDYPMDKQHIEELLSKFSPITDEFDGWLEKQKRRPDAETQKLKYFEVIAPLLNKVAGRVNCNQQIDLPSPIYMTVEPAQTCRELHEQFPLLKMTPYYLCTDAVYEIFEPHVRNPSLFRVYSVDVD